ncbi:MAG: DNA-processing protein DprA [Alphaproteobacteria bacterium]|nr:DNA-processing protein DprA [Alphaproteobacteria bacterium]
MSWLRLLRSRRVGISTFFRLMAEHDGAEAALEVLPDIAKASGVSDYTLASREAAERELAAGHRAGARLLAFGSGDYPTALMDIPDPPPLLWVIGDPALFDRPMVALVGARNASSLGTRMARKIAGDLGADGHVIVSGLARGIDTAAHLASVDTGTIAVMAGGVDVIYPAENASLAQEIGDKGLLLSEGPMHMHPQARHFPARNRLISGLARAVVIVEAAAKSGSLITARNALDQGRDVFAVPGHPFDARAAGCNMLIRDGAILVRGARDVVEAIVAPEPATSARAVEAPPAKEPRSLQETAALHREILSRLGPSPLAEDQLIRDLSVSAGLVGPALLSLELDGKIRRAPGGMVSLPG